LLLLFIPPLCSSLFLLFTPLPLYSSSLLLLFAPPLCSLSSASFWPSSSSVVHFVVCVSARKMFPKRKLDDSRSLKEEAQAAEEESGRLNKRPRVESGAGTPTPRDPSAPWGS